MDMTLEELSKTSQKFVAAAETKSEEVGTTFFAEERPTHECAMIALSVEMPDTIREMNKFQKDATAWVAQALKRSPEVNLSKLTPKEVKGFDVAKMTEVNNWIRESACKVTHRATFRRIGL